MGLKPRRALAASFAGFVLTLLAGLGSVSAEVTPAAGTLLVRVDTSDPVRLATIAEFLPPVRVLDSFALAWGDAAGVESARRAGITATVLGPRRAGRLYAVIHPRSEWEAPPGKVLWSTPTRAVLEYAPEDQAAVWRAFESLPILVRPVVLPGLPGKSASGDLPPLPRAADPLVQALVDAVSADSLIAVTRFLEDFGSRRSQEAECVAVADSLARRLRRFGVPDVSLYDFNTWSDDVVGVQPGRTSPGEIYIICGHYDSTSRGGNAPGADDNGTGTAAVIEAARLLSPFEFEATIIYLAVSGEEQGLVGSEAWAAAARARGDDIRGVINLDMVGWRRADDPPDLDLITNLTSEELRYFVLAAGALYLPDFAIVDGAFGGGNSDQQSFWDFGYQALTFHEDTDTSNPFYHTDTDRVGPSVNDPVFFRHNVQVAIAGLAELARPVRAHIEHAALLDPPIAEESYPVSARITSRAPLVPESLLVRYRVNAGDFLPLPLQRLGAADSYATEIPAQDPADLVEYYLEAVDTEGRHVTEPPLAPSNLNAFVVGRSVAFLDGFADDRGWTVGGPGDDATSGAWVRANPVGTGTQAEADADGDSLCLVTGNGEPGGDAGAADVDGGRTTVTSPRLDLARAIAADLEFSYWFADETFPDDSLRVLVSNDDGASWAPLDTITTSERTWRRASYPRLQDRLPLTGTMRLRFTVADEGRASLLEAGIDAVRARSVVLPVPPPPPPPSATRLLPPEPQPFRGSVGIRFELPHEAAVELAIYDVRGRRVTELERGTRPAGRHLVTWDGRDGRGRAVPSGLYFLRMTAGETTLVQRLMRIR